MILNYQRRTSHESCIGPKEREYMGGTVTVDGVTFTDAWLIRTGKNGVIKRFAKDSKGIFILNRYLELVTETRRGRVKVFKP